MRTNITLCLSILTFILFTVLASGCKINKIHMNAFNYNISKEDLSQKGTYLVKNNGEKVMGEKISWKSGLLSKEQIKIDDQKFKISEIKGYRQGTTYYGRLKNDYIQRIVHGPRINVYVKFTQASTTSTTSTGYTTTRNYTRTDHYAQKGEDGAMIGLAGQKDIKRLVADCPLAKEMADLSNRKMRKAVKKSGTYLNKIFEIYNNGCEK